MNRADHLHIPHGTINYSIVFDFEENFDYTVHREWIEKYWTQVFYYAGIYMVLIYLGKLFMQNRPRFELKGPLFIWNLSLAVFSIIGTIRTFPELVHVLSEYGMKFSVCNPSYVEVTKVSGFWCYLFCMSKVPELGDTVFIVLRKQPLIFLHWYHHVTVLIYTWYSYSQHIAPARWYIAMNYAVHASMYSYYALKSLKFRVPRQVSMFITTFQLLQMVVGCYVNYVSYQVLQRGEPCRVNMDNIRYSVLMYFSYFLLFAQFFYTAYMRKSSYRKAAAKLE